MYRLPLTESPAILRNAPSRTSVEPETVFTSSVFPDRPVTAAPAETVSSLSERMESASVSGTRTTRSFSGTLPTRRPGLQNTMRSVPSFTR